MVHHANYLVWFEQARTQLCATTELPYHEIENLGVYLMVTGAHLSYRGGATYGDTVVVSCWIDRLASRIVHFGYEVSLDGQLLVRGTTEHAWVDRESMKTIRIPERVKPIFEKLAGKS